MLELILLCLLLRPSYSIHHAFTEDVVKALVQLSEQLKREIGRGD